MSGSSDVVRRLAEREYVEPARSTGRPIKIGQGDLKAKLVAQGFPARNANQVGTSIEAERFWKPLGLRMCSPKGQSRANDTVYEFEFVHPPALSRTQSEAPPDERAERFVRSLKGLLKKELAEYGGAEGFMRWVRGESE